MGWNHQPDQYVLFQVLARYSTVPPNGDVFCKWCSVFLSAFSIYWGSNVRCVKCRVGEFLDNKEMTRVPARLDKTVDGSEIRRSPVDMVNICKYSINFLGCYTSFLVVCRIFSINSMSNWNLFFFKPFRSESTHDQSPPTVFQGVEVVLLDKTKNRVC